MTTHPPRRPRHVGAESGQILVLTVVMALGLLAVLGLVADGGLLLARHRELQNLADAAARAGAGQLDVATFRASGGQVAQLDPTQASAAARRQLRVAGFTGQLRIAASTTQVTVQVDERIRTPIFSSVLPSPVRLKVRAVARPQLSSPQQGP
jgi:Flp pilus assembly protein TadG